MTDERTTKALRHYQAELNKSQKLLPRPSRELMSIVHRQEAARLERCLESWRQTEKEAK